MKKTILFLAALSLSSQAFAGTFWYKKPVNPTVSPASISQISKDLDEIYKCLGDAKLQTVVGKNPYVSMLDAYHTAKTSGTQDEFDVARAKFDTEHAKLTAITGC